ncbi:MAG: hypothetical protein II831_09950 [Firmicutes bacterium]|nr:hypothetical protein [Bacillota bacterium]
MDMIHIKEELQRNLALQELLRRNADPSVPGHLVKQKNKDGSMRFYHAYLDADLGKKVYRRLRPEDKDLIKVLQANGLREHRGKDLAENVKMLAALEKNYHTIDPDEWMPLLPAELKTCESAPLDRQFDWEELKSSAGKFRPDGLIYEADERMFRSKGEALHALCFSNAGIEYIYEPEIRIGSITFHPDFAVRNKRTGRIYFWEFFGMLDVEEYQNAFSRKLPALMKLGIIPGYNLICTCEFKGINALSVSDIEAKIHAYLL